MCRQDGPTLFPAHAKQLSRAPTAARPRAASPCVDLPNADAHDAHDAVSPPVALRQAPRDRTRSRAIDCQTGLHARLPDDIPQHSAPAILDVAGAPAQTARLVGHGETVWVVGGGGKSGTRKTFDGDTGTMSRFDLLARYSF